MPYRRLKPRHSCWTRILMFEEVVFLLLNVIGQSTLQDLYDGLSIRVIVKIINVFIAIHFQYPAN